MRLANTGVAAPTMPCWAVAMVPLPPFPSPTRIGRWAFWRQASKAAHRDSTVTALQMDSSEGYGSEGMPSEPAMPCNRFLLGLREAHSCHAGQSDAFPMPHLHRQVRLECFSVLLRQPRGAAQRYSTLRHGVQMCCSGEKTSKNPVGQNECHPACNAISHSLEVRVLPVCHTEQ